MASIVSCIVCPVSCILSYSSSKLVPRLILTARKSPIYLETDLILQKQSKEAESIGVCSPSTNLMKAGVIDWKAQLRHIRNNAAIKIQKWWKRTSVTKNLRESAMNRVAKLRFKAHKERLMEARRIAQKEAEVKRKRKKGGESPCFA